MKYLSITFFLMFVFFGYLSLFTFNEQHIPNCPYLSGDSLRSHCDFVFDEVRSFNAADIQKPAIIFVTTHYLDRFFKEKHPEVKFPYVLVTHNSDEPVPGSFAEYLDDPKLLHWFGQNPSLAGHPKFSPIPIGIANQFWPHGRKEIFDQAIKRSSRIAKKHLFYINFSIPVGNSVDETWAMYQKERVAVSNKFSKQPFTYTGPRKSSADYLDDLAASYFVASPRGHGLDCHRTWEALLMGAYPVVKTSPLDSVYADLPVIIINDWADITEEFLKAKYAELSVKQWSCEKLYAQYWIDKIRATARRNLLKNQL